MDDWMGSGYFGWCLGKVVYRWNAEKEQESNDFGWTEQVVLFVHIHVNKLTYLRISLHAYILLGSSVRSRL